MTRHAHSGILSLETFRPTGSNVLLKRRKTETQTASGLFLPEAQAEESADTFLADVLATGPGRVNHKGVQLPMSVKRGDVVVIPCSTGHVIGDFLILQEEMLLGVME